MANLDEGMKWTGDFTQWRIEIAKNGQSLSDIRHEINKIVRSTQDWTEEGKRRVADLTRKETELMRVRQQLNQQLKRFQAEGTAAGGATAFGDGGAFNDRMKQTRMQMIAIGFAIDDMLTVMSQQDGMKGFINGLAAAANNASVLLAAFHPLLAILPAAGVMMLKLWNAPVRTTTDSIKEQVDALRQLQEQVQAVIDKRREMEVGGKVAEEEKRHRDIKEQIAAAEAERQKVEDAWRERHMGMAGLGGFAFGVRAIQNMPNRGWFMGQQWREDFMMTLDLERRKEGDAIRGMRAVSKNMSNQIAGLIEEQKKLLEAEKEKLLREDLSPEAKRKFAIEQELLAIDAQRHDMKAKGRIPGRKEREFRKTIDALNAEKERIDIQLNTKEMEKKQDQTNRLLEEMNKNLGGFNRPSLLTPRPQVFGPAGGAGGPN